MYAEVMDRNESRSSKIKFYIFSELTTARLTLPDAGEWALNFVQVDRYIQWQCKYCRALAKWLKHSIKHFIDMVNKERQAWQAFSNCWSVILNTTQSVKQCRNWTNEHFFLAVGTAAKINSAVFNFEIRLRLIDFRTYRICRNRIKPRTLASSVICKHCHVSSDSWVYTWGIWWHEWGKWKKK